MRKPCAMHHSRQDRQHREADTLIQTETDTQRGRHTDPDRDSTEPDKRPETVGMASCRQPGACSLKGWQGPPTRQAA